MNLYECCFYDSFDYLFAMHLERWFYWDFWGCYYLFFGVDFLLYIYAVKCWPFLLFCYFKACVIWTRVLLSHHDGFTRFSKLFTFIILMNACFQNKTKAFHVVKKITAAAIYYSSSFGLARQCNFFLLLVSERGINPEYYLYVGFN